MYGRGHVNVKANLLAIIETMLMLALGSDDEVRDVTNQCTGGERKRLKAKDKGRRECGEGIAAANLVLHSVTSGTWSQHIWISTSSFMSLQLPRVICRVKKKKSFIHVGTCMSSVVLFFAMGFHQ